MDFRLERQVYVYLWYC